MENFRIIHKSDNLEIISKLMNSVAKQCGCRVKYNRKSGEMLFHGDDNFQRYIVEETLSFFRAA